MDVEARLRKEILTQFTPWKFFKTTFYIFSFETTKWLSSVGTL